MKTAIKLFATGFLAFAGGFAAGYFVRKKTTEIEIEEISEEEMKELEKQLEDNKEESEEDIFDNNSTTIPQYEKEAYFKRWKAGEESPPSDIYDTRSEETVEDPVTDEDVEKVEEYLSGLSDIDVGTMADWIRYSSLPDGEYDPIELFWYDADNVVCDDNDNPLDNTDKFVGFDVKEEFYLADVETTGDPNVRVIFNNKTHSIYHITRISDTSYSAKKRMEEYGSDGYDDDERPVF